MRENPHILPWLGGPSAVSDVPIPFLESDGKIAHRQHMSKESRTTEIFDGAPDEAGKQVAEQWRINGAEPG